jgi:hypothetical protein
MSFKSFTLWAYEHMLSHYIQDYINRIPFSTDVLSKFTYSCEYEKCMYNSWIFNPFVNTYKMFRYKVTYKNTDMIVWN